MAVYASAIPVVLLEFIGEERVAGLLLWFLNLLLCVWCLGMCLVAGLSSQDRDSPFLVWLPPVWISGKGG